MQATDLLIRQLERQQDSFLTMVKKVPAEKLDWSPKEGSRSALDQFQEVAMVVGENWGLYENLKMTWSEEKMRAFEELKGRVKSVPELEARLRADTGKLIGFIRGLAQSDLSKPVEMPWPGEYTLADIINYPTWNMAYHEGQIAYLLTMLGINPMGMG